jgi:iron complex transport system substrate-binding protein
MVTKPVNVQQHRTFGRSAKFADTGNAALGCLPESAALLSVCSSSIKQEMGRCGRFSKLKSSLVALALLLVLTGWLGGGEAWATANHATRTLTDMAGRTVTVPREIKSVVPLSGALRFMVYLQSLDLVAGMENVEGRWTSPGRLYGLATREKAAELPVIGEGGPGRLPDFERVIALWPDVIISMGMDIDQVETIQSKTGRPVFVLNYGLPGVLVPAEAKLALGLLGELLGREQRAEQLLAFMDHLDADLVARTGDIPADQRPTVYVGAISHKGTQGITSTAATYAPLAWAGGRNVAAEAGPTGHIFIDPEMLLWWEPEVMFIDAGSLAKVAEDYRRNPRFYHKIGAVREGRVFSLMPYNFYHTNIEIAYADAYFIGRTLYPGRFRDIDPAAKADKIFLNFIGLAAYSDLAAELHGFGQVFFEEKELVIR